MSETWLKIRKCLTNHPRIHRISRHLGLSYGEVFFGIYCAWSYFDDHTAEGEIEFASLDLIDQITGIEGLASALVEVRWLEETETGLRMPDFELHNSFSTKRRCMDAKRKAKNRSESEQVPDESVRTFVREPADNGFQGSSRGCTKSDHTNDFSPKRACTKNEQVPKRTSTENEQEPDKTSNNKEIGDENGESEGCGQSADNLRTFVPPRREEKRREEKRSLKDKREEPANSSAFASPPGEKNPKAKNPKSPKSHLDLVQGSCEDSPDRAKLTPARKGKKTCKSKRVSELPTDFQVTDQMRSWFEDKGFTVDLLQATERWKDSMLARGTKYRDWTAAWRNAMTLAQQWEDDRQTRLRGNRPPEQKVIFKELG